MAYTWESQNPAVQYQDTITTNDSLSVGGTLTVGGTLQVGSTLTIPSGVTAGVNTSGNQYCGTYVPHTSTSGTDTTPVAGTVYYGIILTPTNDTVTGLSYMVGSVGGTNTVIVSVYNDSGTLIANSTLAGTTVGTAATMQRVPFTSTLSLVGPKNYYVGVSFNGTTARFRTAAFGVSPAASQAGTFGVLSSIAPVTTFTANVQPIAIFY